LNTNVAIISKTINQGFKMNFNDFINTTVLKRLNKPLLANIKKITLLGIVLIVALTESNI
jgi:hypothetical protein